jgi:hypothetical protein
MNRIGPLPWTLYRSFSLRLAFCFESFAFHPETKTSTILAEASGLMDYKAGTVPTLIFEIIVTWIGGAAQLGPR